jgi:hypothetical protein
VKVLEKFKKYYKFEKGRIFQYKDSYQLTQHDLDNEDNELIFSYEIYGPFKRFFVKELQERKNKYDKEVIQFGRFFLMEGFFNKNDKDLWIEAIEALSNINELVREDIRDSILNEKDEKEKEKDELINEKLKGDDTPKETNISNKHKESSSESLSSRVYIKRNPKMKLGRSNVRKKSKEGSVLIKKKMIVRQQSINSVDFAKINLESLRPPKVWNYPIFRLKKLKLEKNTDGKLTITNIRSVDPTQSYIDGRVQKFNKLFETLYKNMRYYWNTGKKADTWEYFYDKVLKALNIKYQTDKLLRREQIKKAMEEEAKKKEEEAKKKEDEGKEEDKKEDRKEEDKKEEDKKDEKTINTSDIKIGSIHIEDKKENNYIINSENTITTTNAINTNSSMSFIKKIKIKPSAPARNKKGEAFTNETSS